jgi:hypothetical protein
MSIGLRSNCHPFSLACGNYTLTWGSDFDRPASTSRTSERVGLNDARFRRRLCFWRRRVSSEVWPRLEEGRGGYQLCKCRTAAPFSHGKPIFNFSPFWFVQTSTSIESNETSSLNRLQSLFQMREVRDRCSPLWLWPWKRDGLLIT